MKLGDWIMSTRTKELAATLGATVVGKVPKTGGGAFGAARLGRIVADLQRKLVPSQGKRPGRPTKSEWNRRPKVPMSTKTERRLIELAKKASTSNRRVSPMQLAARLLEEALADLSAD
jgi:hypothetical protein